MVEPLGPAVFGIVTAETAAVLRFAGVMLLCVITPLKERSFPISGVNGNPCTTVAMLVICQPLVSLEKNPLVLRFGKWYRTLACIECGTSAHDAPLSSNQLNGLGPTAFTNAPSPQSVLYIWPAVMSMDRL